jgi:hypothetical protein
MKHIKKLIKVNKRKNKIKKKIVKVDNYNKIVYKIKNNNQYQYNNQYKIQYNNQCNNLYNYKIIIHQNKF